MDPALGTVILARVLGTERLTGAFGLLCLFRGVALLGVGPVGGRTSYRKTGTLERII